MQEEMRRPDDSDIKSQRTPVCLPAAELAGSRMSKAFSLLQLLSEDLAHKVAVADEAYRLYKNIQLEAQDEERDEESSLYEFLKRVRLNSALDALREVRCAARSARAPVLHTPPSSPAPRSSPAPITTYRSPLDDQIQLQLPSPPAAPDHRPTPSHHLPPAASLCNNDKPYYCI
ncbi:unnamed protein product, partial [Brenthis ino]